MRVYCETPSGLSKAMGRVVAALKRNAPRKDVEFVDSPSEAELVFLHVIGYPETAGLVRRLREEKKKYVIIQYCMRSTQKPNTCDWIDLWQGAELVWSYYDLHELMKIDGATGAFQFYCSPLGVNPFFSSVLPFEVKCYTLMTSGYVAESESVTEAAGAVAVVHGTHFHLGPREVAPRAHATAENISDYQLLEVYNRTCWVSGLRRAEGFEMPAAEGLCAGARPIVFDAPHYRRWYDGLADFIPENSPAEVTQSIVKIFKRGYRPLSETERHDATKRFDWARIIPDVWDGVL